MGICNACMHSLHDMRARACARTLKRHGPIWRLFFPRWAGSQRDRASFPALWCLLRLRTFIYFHGMGDRCACARGHAWMRARACAHRWERHGSNPASVFASVHRLYTTELITLTLKMEYEPARPLRRCFDKPILWMGRATLIAAGQSQIPKMCSEFCSLPAGT